MSFKHQIRLIAWLSSGALALTGSGTAHARTPVFAAVMQPPSPVVMLATTNSLCISITYDKNGNRVSQTVASMTTSTTIWGSGSYGCFVWKS